MRASEEKAPKILDLPIGLKAIGQRKEFDSLDTVMVPANRYWGARMEWSLSHFNLGHDRMPHGVYHAYGYVEQAAAIVNARHRRLQSWKGKLIERVCDEVISGALDQDFPLYVWQTGSGTQSNMNVNEVISNRCIQLIGVKLGSQEPVHPNDHVNMGQSSNDTFPTAMHIAAYKMMTEQTLPALKRVAGPLSGAAIAVLVAQFLRGPAKAQEARAAMGDPSATNQSTVTDRLRYGRQPVESWLASSSA